MYPNIGLFDDSAVCLFWMLIPFVRRLDEMMMTKMMMMMMIMVSVLLALKKTLESFHHATMTSPRWVDLVCGPSHRY